MRYLVHHRTSYDYDDVVRASYGMAYLIPRDTVRQTVSAIRITADPEPIDASTHTDYYGNAAWYFQIPTEHRRLEVVSSCAVEVVDQNLGRALQMPWEQARPRGPQDWRQHEFTEASPMIAIDEQVREYARPSFTSGRALGESVMDLVHRFAGDFEYRPGSTTITSTVRDVMNDRAGVCQDFAQVMIAALRSMGLAARYVSGYLATEPPPGKERVRGADATHAWLAVWVRDAGWFSVDPTNDQAVNDRYVTVAWGRDYGDVPPLKGVIFSESGSSELSVAVDVEPA